MRRNNNNNWRGPRGGGFNREPGKSGLYVEVRNGDFNYALRKFKKKVQEAGIIPRDSAKDNTMSTQAKNVQSKKRLV